MDSLTQSVQDADKGIVDVEEGADPGQGQDKASGQRTVEQEPAQPLPEGQQGYLAQTPQQDAGGDRLTDDPGKSLPVAGCLDLRHGGKEHGG